MTTTYEDVLELFRQVAEAQQETERLLQQQSLEADRRFRETERLIQEQSRATDRKLNKLEDLFTSQWGRLIESLVDGDLVSILNQRGIQIADTTTRLKNKLPGGQHYEFDIVAHNGDTIVVVEVKTTLRPKDVTHFIERLDHIKAWIPRYANYHVLGAMAWLTADKSVEQMLENRGLFSIRATGNSASIQNAQAFTPRVW